MAITKELKDAIKKMQDGDETAFATFYEKTYSYVYAKAKFVMHEEEDALDLTQETYIQAYRGIGSIEDENNVYAWLGGIVYRQGMRIFNKKKELLTGEEQDYLFEEMESGEATPEQAVEQQATVNIVKGMIDELPELQRVAIVAFYFDNMKIDEIASMCECSANTIKSRLNYAKKYLKEKVEAHEKQNRYKLCSISPTIILLAFKGLFAEPEYKMPAQAVKGVYMASCNSLGIEAVSSAIAGGSATSAGAATGGSATVSAGAAAGGVAVATVKVGLTVKIGATVAALLATGGIAAAVVHTINSNQSQEPVAVVEEEAESEEPSSEIQMEELPTEELLTEEMPIEETQIEETQIEESLYDASILMEGLYKYDAYTISITNANVTDYKNATFDVEIVNSAYEDGTVETLTVSQVVKTDGVAEINATSNLGNQWMGSLLFMEDGSIRMDMDLRTEDGTYTMGYGMSLMIFTKAEAEGLITERVPEEGTYIFTEGTDVYTDGGYVLSISEVNEDVDTTFVMQFEIISDGGYKVDGLQLDTDYVFMENGLGTFWGTTGWGVSQYGYLYINEDGSISLSYTSRSGLENVLWHGAYPDATFEPIILKKN